MNLLLLFTGGVYVIAGTLSTLMFVSGYLMSKRWLRSEHDRQGGKLRVTIGNDHVGRQDRAAIDEAARAAVANGLKEPRIYREGKPSKKKW